MILDGLKKLFIPTDGFIENCVNNIKNEFLVTFGVSDFDIKLAFGSEASLTDINMTYNSSLFSYTGNVVKMSYVINALATFRPYIRGLISLFLCIYSINQFCGLIGQQGLAIGVSFLMGRGGDNGKED